MVVKTLVLPVFLVTIMIWLQLMSPVTCTEFLVGGEDGWAVPTAKEEKTHSMYNDWASNNRFKVDDIVHFKYEKDSVLVVTEEEYGKCHSSHPLFFSNNGDTVFKLDRPSLFYFISGISGHCEKGQRMIIKVLEPDQLAAPAPASPPYHGASPANETGPDIKSGSAPPPHYHHHPSQNIITLLALGLSILVCLIPLHMNACI